MSYTTDDLAVHVLRKLRIIDASETISDIEDAHVDYVTETYRAKWEEITAHGRELTYWAYDEIPNPVFLIMRDLIALEVQEGFGFPIAPAEKVAQEEMILRRLRKHVQVQGTGQPTKALYY